MKLNLPVHGVTLEQLSEAIGVDVATLTSMSVERFKVASTDTNLMVTRTGVSVVFFFNTTAELNGLSTFHLELLKKIIFAEQYYVGGAREVFLVASNELYQYGEETDQLVDLTSLKDWLMKNKDGISCNSIPLTMDLIRDHDT